MPDRSCSAPRGRGADDPKPLDAGTRIFLDILKGSVVVPGASAFPL